MKLKGMTIVECMVAFVILIGVLVMAYSGMVVSSNYILRGRETTTASSTAEQLIATVASKVSKADDAAEIQQIKSQVSAELKDCYTVSEPVTMVVKGVNIKGRYVSVEIKVAEIKTERYVRYCEFVPTDA